MRFSGASKGAHGPGIQGECDMETMIALKDTVDFAMKRGATSLSFYTACASSHDDESISRLFEGLCVHERSQQVRLLEAQSIIRLRSHGMAIRIERIREYLVNAKPSRPMTLTQALFWASVRAETSHKLYHQLGEYMEQHDLKRLFLLMAHDEGKRKLQIERAYDDLLLQGTQAP
jgi:rubrerythrin